MEEDTAKQFHKDTGTYIDFNRAGTPLIEIVSKPDMHSAKEAAAYVETLRKNLLYLNVSDVKMEEGSMRCDVNISLSKDKDTLGTKTEIKNLNSIANVQKAVQAEIERQSALLDAGEKVEQATRRYDEAQKTTILMRKKEGNVDYKYFPEPNIFPIQLDLDWVKSIQDNLEELPDARLARFMKDYELSEYDAGVLVSDREMADFFEEVLKSTKFAKKACNWIIGDVSAYLNKNNLTFKKVPCSSENLASLINVIEAGEISGKQGKVVFEEVNKEIIDCSYNTLGLIANSLILIISIAIIEISIMAIKKLPKDKNDYNKALIISNIIIGTILNLFIIFIVATLTAIEEILIDLTMYSLDLDRKFYFNIK